MAHTALGDVADNTEGGMDLIDYVANKDMLDVDSDGFIKLPYRPYSTFIQAMLLPGKIVKILGFAIHSGSISGPFLFLVLFL